MDAAVTMQKEAAPKPAPASDLKLVFRNAQRAFDLIQKHRTPPDPKTYAVWYAYVEATDPRVIERVDSALAEHGTLTPFDISSIFRELLTEEPAAVSARHTIGMAIEKEIDEVMKISRVFRTATNSAPRWTRPTAPCLGPCRPTTSPLWSPPSCKTISAWPKRPAS